jgi:hypothetical protein
MIRLLRTDELLLRALADITRELDTNESTRLYAAPAQLSSDCQKSWRYQLFAVIKPL